MSSDLHSTGVCTLQEGLELLCRRILCKSVADEDVATQADSVSGTTIAASARSGVQTAASYLLHLGRTLWGCQSESGITISRGEVIMDNCLYAVLFRTSS